MVVSDFRSLRGDIVSEALSAHQSPAVKIPFLAAGWSLSSKGWVYLAFLAAWCAFNYLLGAGSFRVAVVVGKHTASTFQRPFMKVNCLDRLFGWFVLFVTMRQLFFSHFNVTDVSANACIFAAVMRSVKYKR